MHEPKRIFCDKPITALTQNYSANLERIFLTIPLWEREFPALPEMPALPIKIWTGRPVLHIAVPCDEK